jgi:predicted alpha/beta hydrolase family esterase
VLPEVGLLILFMKRVILIHGWQGCPGNHWKGWLKKKLEIQGITVIEPEMPNSSNRPAEWVNKLEEVIGTPDDETILIGHSLGCPTVIGYLMQLTGKEKIAGAILVAGFSSKLEAHGILHLWDFDPQEVKKAKKHCGNFISIVSDNDASVPLEKSKELNDLVGGKFILEHKK